MSESQSSCRVLSDAPRRATAGHRGWRSVIAGAGLIGMTAGMVGLTGGRASAAGMATPTVDVAASLATSIGMQVFANVNLKGGSAPTGTLTFKLFGPSDPTCTSAIFTSTVAVSGVSADSDAYTTSAAGTYRWEASYSGDANNNPVGPTPCSYQTAAVTVARARAVVALTAPAPVAGAIHAALNLYGFGPTGTVTVTLSPPGDSFCETAAFTTSVAVSAAGAYTSASYTPTVSGTYRWRANYSGDANNMPTPTTGCLDSADAVTVMAGVGTPVVALSPTSVGFPAQTVATASAAQNVAVSNSGNASLNVTSAAVTGANAADFQVTGNTCTTAVAPGASCNLAVSFIPSAAGARAASVTLADNAAGGSQTVALTGTGTTTARPAALIYPADGQTGVDTTRAITWSTVPNAIHYYLEVGTTVNGYDVVNSGVLPASQSSYSAPAMPSGRTLYTIMWTYVNGGWIAQISSFTTASAAGSQASLTYPTNGQTNVDTTRPFTWSTNPAASYYWLMIGTSAGDAGIVNSGLLPATQSSFAVPAMPAGRTLYAQLYSYVNGSWVSQTVTFSAQAR